MSRASSIRAHSVIIWVIYYDPADYPGKFVVRRWQGIEADQWPRAICPTLETARAAVPKGYINVGKSPGSDSVILEEWI